MSSLYFTDAARHAAHHLLAGQFGERLRQITTITDNNECLRVDYEPAATRMQLSGGERILLALMESMTESVGGEFTVGSLHLLDDASWDLVIATLFIHRGRALVVAS